MQPSLVSLGRSGWVYAAAVVVWILCVALIGFLLEPLVYIGAMIQAYIAAKNFNECNGLQVR